MIPIGFLSQNLSIGILVLSLGIVLSMWLEQKIQIANNTRIENSSLGNNNFESSGTLSPIYFVIHKIPQGIAIGSLSAIDMAQAFYITSILMLHWIQETFDIFAHLRKSYSKCLIVLVFFILSPILMLMGTISGYFISTISQTVSVLLIFFSGGTIIHVSCGEVFPDYENICNRKIAVLGAVLGFIVGVSFSVPNI